MIVINNDDKVETLETIVKYVDAIECALDAIGDIAEQPTYARRVLTEGAWRALAISTNGLRMAMPKETEPYEDEDNGQ